MLRLKKDWFNPLYFHLLKYIEVPTIRKIMIYGGKSSAKTFSIAQLLSIKAYTQKASSICYRKEQTTIKTTLKPAFVKSIEGCYLQNVTDVMDFQINSVSDAKIVFRGLDTEGKVKGIEGFKYLLFDELDHYTEEEWLQANLSLRGIENQKLFATWNPVDENIWIKKELDTYQWTDLPLIVDDNQHSKLDDGSSVQLSNDGKILLIKTTYLDNKWVVGGDGYGVRDENLIDEYLKLKDYNENSYNVNVLGQWGVTNKDGKFCWAFHSGQIKSTTHDPERTTWATFDFNVNPMTCSVVQVFHEIKTIRAIESIKLENSNVYEMCERLNASYPGALWMITGDASGNSHSAMVKDNLTYYQIILMQMNLSMQQMQVPTVNPRIEDNKIVVNAVHKLWTVEIDPVNCAELIYDLQYVEVDGMGKIIKDRTSKAKFADFLDGWRYILNIAVKPYMNILGF